MRMAFCSLLAACLLAGFGRAEPRSPDTAEDEQLLKSAGVAVDGPGLLAYFRKQVPADVTAERLAALIGQLGDGDFATREKATAALKGLGGRALPELRRALDDPDPEVRRRAQDCVDALLHGRGPALRAAAARLLRARRPPGACAALVAYLPFAEDEAAADEAVATLVVLGVSDGRVDAAVAGALHDKAPARRAAAALLLGRSGSAGQKDEVRRLLHDPDPGLRLRAAQGLLAGRDKGAVPALLDLLGDGPLEVARQAEDLLDRAAGDRAPRVSLGETKAERGRCRDAWAAWWQANGAKVDLTRADVDLQVFNPTLLARDTARKLLEAWLVKGDLATARRLTEVPFLLPGGVGQAHQTREELDKFLGEVQERARQMKFTVSTRQAVTLEEHFKKGLGEEAKELTGVRKAELRVVYFVVGVGGHNEDLAGYVRVSGGRARVVGLGRGLPASKLGK
jgi:hypothetical protein